MTKLSESLSQLRDLLYLDYHVELQGGDGVSNGNVFAVNSGGYFGPVCDDAWGPEEADVVCK